MDTVEKFAYYAHRDEAIEGEIPTPKHICTNMVNMSDNSIYDRIDGKYLDIYCKSGRFLKAIYEKLMASASLNGHYGNDTDKLKEEILKHYLYGIAPNEAIAAIIRKELYGDPNHTGNIIVIEDYKAKMKSNNFGRNSNGSVKTFREEINERFGQGMKFDEVIGNPPYNNDAYIDFVRGGYNLIKDDGCIIMITPAKWQAKGGKKNEDFRKDIVPHMSKIVWYPDERDVFDIGCSGGISFFVSDREIHKVKHIINITKLSWIKPKIMDRELCTCLNNTGYQFVKKFESYKKIGFGHYDETKKYRYRFSKLFTDRNIHEQNLVINPPYIENKDDVSVLSANYPIRYSADNVMEVESFISYVYSKFARFLVLIGICSTEMGSDYCWRFVPDPGPFDHIFTDAELYQKYNLTQDEINIIESVVKERT